MQIKLDEIIKNKFKEVAEKKKRERDFVRSILNPKFGNISIISEIKIATPIKGVLSREKDVCLKSVMYERGGADAISVVTDNKYFGGSLDFIRDVKNEVSLPVLMKDFIIDPYQIFEAKIIGADALLFIAKILTKRQLKEFILLASSLGIEPVVEVQNADELRNVLALSERQRVECVAVNARNLDDFQVDINQACSLLKLIPKEKLALGFSGVKGRDEVEKYKQAGAKAVLVGNALMKTTNIIGFIKSLKSI